jgi:hypothetical protein
MEVKFMNELSITKQYPAANFNLLGNTDVMVSVPDIQSPVIQQIKLNPDPTAGDVYVQQKAMPAWKDRPATEAKYALTKNALKKLADGAGIKMMSSEHVVPSTCQKCIAINQNAGKVIQCGNCRNKDVAYRVTIGVPQLTGETLTVEDTHEIIVDNVTADMSDKQRAEFMKHLPQICEAKALNGAIRTALHIKGTYTRKELEKPFIVAYLIPNLDNSQVKQAAISSMFASSNRLFGNSAPSVQQIESRVPEAHRIEAADGEVYDQYIDDVYTREYEEPQPAPRLETQPAQGAYQPAPYQPVPQPPAQESVYKCSVCGEAISDKVYSYSTKRLGRALCYKCQKNG